MPLNPPVLDDRSYDQIVADARQLIPHYAPDWTNLNPSDPGITLLELFAWMTEMLLFRLNRVPELNYVKFLQLLGIELEPAQPAATELTFTLVSPVRRRTPQSPRGRRSPWPGPVRRWSSRRSRA